MDAGTLALIIIGVVAVLGILGWLSSFYYFDHK